MHGKIHAGISPGPSRSPHPGWVPIPDPQRESLPIKGPAGRTPEEAARAGAEGGSSIWPDPVIQKAQFFKMLQGGLSLFLCQPLRIFIRISASVETAKKSGAANVHLIKTASPVVQDIGCISVFFPETQVMTFFRILHRMRPPFPGKRILSYCSSSIACRSRTGNQPAVASAAPQSALPRHFSGQPCIFTLFCCPFLSSIL